MTTFKNYLMYFLWPNPGNASYSNPKVQALIVLSGLLIVLSFALRFWRRSTKNPVTKRLTRSWPTATLWFGIIALVMIISRVEFIGFLSMRLWWVVWVFSLAFYLWIQVRLFRTRHYEQLPRVMTEDPREKYLPRRKK